MNYNNYKGISLLDTSYKVLSNVLLNKLKPYGEEIVGEYQRGFRRGKSTMGQIYVVKQVMEKYYEYNQELFMFSIDYIAYNRYMTLLIGKVNGKLWKNLGYQQKSQDKNMFPRLKNLNVW